MAIKIIDAVAANTTSSAWHVAGADEHTVSSVFSGCTALVVYLYGTNEGRAAVAAGTASFHILQTYTASAGEISAGYLMFHVVNKPVEFIKVKVDGTTAGTMAMTAYYSGNRQGVKVA